MKTHPLLTRSVIAIIAITAILITAMLNGINGALVGVGLSLIAGMGGYIIGKVKKS